MKKLCLLFSALILIFSLTACGMLDFSKPDTTIPELENKQTDGTEQPPEQTEETATEPETTGNTEEQPTTAVTEEGLRSDEDSDLVDFVEKASATLAEAAEAKTDVLWNADEKGTGGYYYTTVSVKNEMKAALEKYFEADLYEYLMLIYQVKDVGGGILAVPKNREPYYVIDTDGDFAMLEKNADSARISIPFTLVAKSSGKAKNDIGECVLRKNSDGYWKISSVSQWYDDYVLRMYQKGYGQDGCITKAGYQLSGLSYKGEKIEFSKLAGEKRAVLSPSGKYSLKVERISGSREDKLAFVILDRNGQELYESIYPFSEYFTYYAAWDSSLDALWVYVGLPSSGAKTDLFGLSSRGLIYCSGDGGEWAETPTADVSGNKNKVPTIFKQLSTAFE